MTPAPDLFTSVGKPRVQRANWKPDHCADCGVVHPSWSLDGSNGPWRCQECHRDALERKAT